MAAPGPRGLDDGGGGGGRAHPSGLSAATSGSAEASAWLPRDRAPEVHHGMVKGDGAAPASESASLPPAAPAAASRASGWAPTGSTAPQRITPAASGVALVAWKCLVAGTSTAAQKRPCAVLARDRLAGGRLTVVHEPLRIRAHQAAHSRIKLSSSTFTAAYLPANAPVEPAYKEGNLLGPWLSSDHADLANPIIHLSGHPGSRTGIHSLSAMLRVLCQLCFAVRKQDSTATPLREAGDNSLSALLGAYSEDDEEDEEEDGIPRYPNPPAFQEGAEARQMSAQVSDFLAGLQTNGLLTEGTEGSVSERPSSRPCGDPRATGDPAAGPSTRSDVEEILAAAVAGAEGSVATEPLIEKGIVTREGPLKLAVDTQSGGSYYWNSVTGESSWRNPSDVQSPAQKHLETSASDGIGASAGAAESIAQSLGGLKHEGHDEGGFASAEASTGSKMDAATQVQACQQRSVKEEHSHLIDKALVGAADEGHVSPNVLSYLEPEMDALVKHALQAAQEQKLQVESRDNVEGGGQVQERQLVRSQRQTTHQLDGQATDDGNHVAHARGRTTGFLEESAEGLISRWEILAQRSRDAAGTSTSQDSALLLLSVEADVRLTDCRFFQSISLDNTLLWAYEAEHLRRLESSFTAAEDAAGLAEKTVLKPIPTLEVKPKLASPAGEVRIPCLSEAAQTMPAGLHPSEQEVALEANIPSGSEPDWQAGSEQAASLIASAIPSGSEPIAAKEEDEHEQQQQRRHSHEDSEGSIDMDVDMDADDNAGPPSVVPIPTLSPSLDLSPSLPSTYGHEALPKESEGASLLHSAAVLVPPWLVEPGALSSGTSVDASSQYLQKLAVPSFTAELSTVSDLSPHGPTTMAKDVSGGPVIRQGPTVFARPSADSNSEMAPSETEARGPPAAAAVAASSSVKQVPAKAKRKVLASAVGGPSLQSNKKVSSLLNKWKAAKEELQESDQEEQDTAEAREIKRLKELEEWRRQQLASGGALENANFQPKAKRAAAKASIKDATTKDSPSAAEDTAATTPPPSVAVESSRKETLQELSRGLPSGWQAFFDQASGDVYYGNLTTKATSWERPN
eukprot:SM000129S26120  [mRNA]  locus=s129:45826:51275:- [translate_table: standard]